MRVTRRTKFITCPRCGLKVPEGIPVCPDCDLIFERLSLATNKDAKRKKRRGDRDFILKSTVLPSDVKYWKLLLLTIFTGLVGGHHFYVGRYLRGTISVILFGVTLVFGVFLNGVIAALYPTWMELVSSLIIGPSVVMWIVDIWLVALKKYKVPIAIDLESESTNEIIEQK